MCIISFHLQQHPIYKLILVANRDEFYERPTAAAHFWEEAPYLLAGRDLKAMGTWLGITKQGRFAALTNYRNPQQEQTGKNSRGDILTRYLHGNQSASDFLLQLQKERQQYNGFNLLVGDVNHLTYYSRQEDRVVPLNPGTYSVSNASLLTPWPKVEKARTALHDYVMRHDNISVEDLMAQLHDEEKAEDTSLPETGVGLEFERQLSSIFIQTPTYGTRSSTVLTVTHDNEVDFTERTFHKGACQKDTHFRFQIDH